jgi:hypothetical protein
MIDPELSNIRNVPGKMGRSEKVDKPTHSPESKEKFKKVMEKGEGEEKDRDDQKKSTKDVSTKGEAAQNVKAPAGQTSIFALSEESAKKEATPVDSEVVEESVTPRFSNEQEPKAQFSQEQPDIAYVNPLSGAPTTVSSTVENAAAPKPQVNVEQIQKMIEQLVDKVQTLSKSGQTDTTMTIKNIPILEGANVVISAFDSAKGEFNIAFENLTAHAKGILDMPINQDALRAGLENKGYVLHILTVTTTQETPIIEEDASASFKSKEEKEEQQEQDTQ